MELPKFSRAAAAIALCICMAVGASAAAIGSSALEDDASQSVSRSALGTTAAALGLPEDKSSLEEQQADVEEAAETESAEESALDDEADSTSDESAEQSDDASAPAEDSEDAAEDSDSQSSAEDSSISFPTTGTVSSNGAGLNMRNGPDASCDIMVSIPSGTVLTLTGLENGWYQTSYNGSTGYVNSQYITLGGTVSESTSSTDASSASSDSTSSSSSSSSSSASSSSSSSSSASSSSSSSSSSGSSSSSSSTASDTAAALVEYAKQFLGCSYVYATAGPTTFDCSGFTSYVYAHFGYTLNRSAAGQYENGQVIEIDESQMQVGDLLLWRAYDSSSAATHAGIYIGDGQYIHASSTAGCVTISSLYPGSTQRYLVGVRRIIS